MIKPPAPENAVGEAQPPQNVVAEAPQNAVAEAHLKPQPKTKPKAKPKPKKKAKKKAMKAMKKKAKNQRRRYVSKRSRSLEMRMVKMGQKKCSRYNMWPDNLTKNKRGKVVPKLNHDAGVAQFDNFKVWNAALKEARAKLTLEGFVKINVGDDGKRLYELATKIKEEMKKKTCECEGPR